MKLKLKNIAHHLQKKFSLDWSEQDEIAIFQREQPLMEILMLHITPWQQKPDQKTVALFPVYGAAQNLMQFEKWVVNVSQWEPGEHSYSENPRELLPNEQAFPV